MIGWLDNVIYLNEVKEFFYFCKEHRVHVQDFLKTNHEDKYLEFTGKRGIGLCDRCQQLYKGGKLALNKVKNATYTCQIKNKPMNWKEQVALADEIIRYIDQIQTDEAIPFKWLDELLVEALEEEYNFLQRGESPKLVKDWKKSQDAKRSWQKNPFKRIFSMRAFHHSPEGRMFHRKLDRHNATKIFYPKTGSMLNRDSKGNDRSRERRSYTN